MNGYCLCVCTGEHGDFLSVCSSEIRCPGTGQTTAALLQLSKGNQTILKIVDISASYVWESVFESVHKFETEVCSGQ